ncbi:MAG: thermonuclease family protein [Sphingomonadaceae bacterium]|nr:thermonuclease family protein [Sphingomonadaceae bacterium]
MKRLRASLGAVGLSVVALACASAWSASDASGGDLIACPAPTHHDGDAIKCEGQRRSMRLYSIDAPEMPGACRPGRLCTPGDPYAARDYLASLTRARSVQCRTLETDRYGRPVVQCFAGTADLSCAMVAAGYAVERYGRLGC